MTNKLRFEEPLHVPEHRARILDLWNEGKDTGEIASLLSLREFQVYNTLASFDGQGSVRVRIERVPAWA
jgi:hypothetical protein